MSIQNKHSAKLYETITTAPKEPNGLVRINKAIAEAGLCSRRKAEEFVTAGCVKVNGEFITSLSHKVRLEVDRIEVDGIELTFNSERVYLLMHKPVQIVCTLADPEGRATIKDVLPLEWQKRRVYPVGRLDYFSEGLLILTNDGDLSLRLAHPRYHLPKVYEVVIRGTVNESILDAMRQGMTLAEGDKLAPIKAQCISTLEDPIRTVLHLTLKQGINRQIRRMCRDLELVILKLTRLSQGPLQLGDLLPGQVRPLANDEVVALRQAVELT